MRKSLSNAVIAFIPSALILSALSGGFSLPVLAQTLQHANAVVPTCANIQMAATYLPESAARGGPAFQFAIHNGTDQAISVVMPAPTSAHWYAREGSRWSWRASNGAGGSPVDAMNPQGRMFAFRVSSNGPSGGAERLVVAAHGFRNWDLSPADNPVLNFRPSCPHCNHPTDRQFRVVFAYAVLPDAVGNSSDDADVLRCGLRAEAVEVPASYANISAGRPAESKLSLLHRPGAPPSATETLATTGPSNTQ